MKLLVLSMNFAPELTGIGKYSGEMAEGLVERGHQVCVVCAPPYYPAWRLGPGYSGWAYSVAHPRPGLTVYRCPVWVPRRPGGLSRLLHQASFALASLPLLIGLALWQRPAVVFAVTPALFCAPAAWLAARIGGARAWLHVQDLEIDAAFGLGLLRGRWLRAACLSIERRLLRGFDRVSTISRSMLRQLAGKGVDLAQSSLLPNWVRLAAIHPRECAADMRLALGIASAQKVLLFSGTMNRKQGLPVLIEVARHLQARRDILFVLCGAGELKAGLQADAADLPNVRFLDLQPAEGLNALLHMADVHLLPQLRGAADLVLPSKLGGMLASGRPVIAAADPGSEIASMIEHCGLLVTPQSVEGFTAAILALCDDDERRHALGRVARSVAERTLGFDAALDRLAQDLVEIGTDTAPVPGWPQRQPTQL